MASPAQYDFTGDGSTRIFPIATRIISQEYLKIEIDEEQILDLSTYDVINNSIVFVLAPLDGAELTIRVASSIEGISELDNLTVTQIVADNILSVNTIAEAIDAGDLENLGVPVRGRVVKRVGVGEELETIIQARDWYNEQTRGLNSYVIFELQDPSYTETVDADDEDFAYLFRVTGGDYVKFAYYYPGSPSIDFGSINGTANCFECEKGSQLDVRNVLITNQDSDPWSTAVRYSGGSSGEMTQCVFHQFGTPIIVEDNSNLKLITSSVRDVARDTAYYLTIRDNSIVTIEDSFTCSSDTKDYFPPNIGIHITTNSMLLSSDGDIAVKNTSNAIHCEKNGKFVSNGGSIWFDQVSDYALSVLISGIGASKGVVELNDTPLTYTNVDTASTIPFNEYQESGSYISDGTVVMGGGGASGEVISTYVQKTINSIGGDFDELSNAIAWLQTQTMTPSGHVNFIMGAGVFEPWFADVYENGFLGAVTLESKQVTFTGEEYGGTIITIPYDLYYYYYYYGGGDQDFALFELFESSVTFNKIRLEADYDYYAYATELAYVRDNSKLTLIDCAVTEFHGVVLENSSSYHGVNTEIYDNQNVPWFWDLSEESTLLSQNEVLSGLLELNVTDRSEAVFVDTISNGASMEDNIDHWTLNLPINTIQADGSFITTDARKLKNAGGYVDLHVGAGQEYPTLQEAMDFTLEVTGGSFRLVLYEDVSCTVTTTQAYSNNYEFVSDALTVRQLSFLGSSSGAYMNILNSKFTIRDTINFEPNTSLLFIQFANSDVTIMGDMGGIALIPADGVNLRLLGVNVTQARECVLWAFAGASIGIYGCNLLGMGMSFSSLSQVYFSSCVMGGADAGNVFADDVLTSVNYGANIHIRALTIQNAVNGLVMSNGAVVKGANRITFTNVTTPYNIPTNEYQYDGTVIIDGASALSFKA